MRSSLFESRASLEGTGFHLETCMCCSCSTSMLLVFFFFSSRRRHTRLQGDWSSDVCSSDLRSHWRQAAIQSLEMAPGRIRSSGLSKESGAPSFARTPIQRLPAKTGSRARDRKSTRLNSSHLVISYAVFCLETKNAYVQLYDV